MMSSSGGYTTIDNQNNVSASVPAVSGPDHVSVKFTDTFSKPAVNGSSSSSGDDGQATGWIRRFTVGAYKPYFDVDTSDVLERIRESLFPFKGNFTEKTQDNPDLYGPFWICTTLIFVAAAIGTFVTYLAHKLQHKDWDYDISLVTWSAGLFYGYVTIVPLGTFG